MKNLNDYIRQAKLKHYICGREVGEYNILKHILVRFFASDAYRNAWNVLFVGKHAGITK